MSSAASSSKVTVGARAVVAADVELVGRVSIGSGCVIHPKASILAHGAPIQLGADCIVEEGAVIINRSNQPMTIGARNLFEVGCYIEASSIGDRNTFEIRCRVGAGIRIGSYCSVSAGSTIEVGPTGMTPEDLQAALADPDSEDNNEDKVGAVPSKMSRQASNTSSASSSSTYPIPEEPEDDAGSESTLGLPQTSAPTRTIADRSVLFSTGVSHWSGEGQGQEEALYAKHIDHLRLTIPQSHKLKAIV